ncbi:MAG TPA: stage II sporulation protein R [Bacillota bacterium]|nr:stage II sporulation protein R [Bacillota bacterium]
MKHQLSTVKHWSPPHWLRLTLLVFLAGMGFGTTIAGANQDSRIAFNRHNLIRLHVLANSDHPDDQRVKLLVRDRVLIESQRWLIGIEDPREALSIINKNKGRMLLAVEDELRRNGKYYGAHLETGVFPFPDRDYPFGRLPAGDYQALRVVLGKGNGHNWWCVLFPPLCFMAKDPKDKEDYRLSQGDNQAKVVYRSEFLEHLLHRNHMVMNDFWRGWSEFFARGSQ